MQVERRDYQIILKEQTYAAWQTGQRNVLNVLPTGGGKCLGRDTPVMMVDGSIKPVQDVKILDAVLGPDGQPRYVINTCKGLDELYKITPVKGDSYIVNSKHLISLKQTQLYKDPKFPCQMKGGEIVNINVEDYIKKSKHFKHVHKGWRTAINFNGATPTFDPYMLGLWLGDGSSRVPAITTIDEEISKYVYNFAEKHEMKVRCEDKKGTKAKNLHLIKKIPRTRQLSYMGEFLQKYNLIRNKHIPHEYKVANKKARLEILAGIMDTDGSYSRKSFDYITISERLMDDVIFIARSLGLSAYKNKVKKTCVNNGVEGTYYRCSINGNIEQIPTILNRKKPTKRKQIKNVLYTGIKVESIGVGEYFGFQIAGADNLFLLGDFTVTHNSVIMSDIVLDGAYHNMNQCVIAHRNELVSQMSAHIGRRGIPHKIIGSDSTIKQIQKQHRTLFNGQQFVHPTARTAVVGVDTLLARRKDLEKWAHQNDRWMVDEAHHLIAGANPNKWGKAIAMMPNAFGSGFTATPCRADGQGLGRHADGVFDVMNVGPSMRQLINQGYLSDFEIVCPTSDLQIDDDELSVDGDWSSQKLKKAAKKSHIVGDVVENYCKYAFGRSAIVFATDIETGNDIAKKFNEWSVRAICLSSETPTLTREYYINEFKIGKLNVLINIDLFDEGFDVPACDVVVMARPTASIGKYRQMVGRALRFMPNKIALIIDMVSNIKRHRLPDEEKLWTLDRRDKRAKHKKDPEELELATCRTCTKPYEPYLAACPHCGAVKPLPAPRERTLEIVEGDLVLLDRAMLEKMRQAATLENPGNVAQRVAMAAGAIAGQGALNRQFEKIAAHNHLKETIAQWAGIQKSRGLDDHEIHRKFWHTTGFDVLTALNAAQTATEMNSLNQTIQSWWRK